MSTQKGNSNRSRSQKYKNHTAFKNDLHDTSHKTKFINNIEIANVCERCKKILEWKVKYKKYKPLKAPSKCIKCEQKSVKHAYHNICLPCAKQFKVCPKCREKTEIIQANPSKEESIKLDAEFQALLKELPERKRRTFIRYMNRNVVCKKKYQKTENDQNLHEEVEIKEDGETCTTENVSRDDLLLKLKSLVIQDGKSENDFDSDIDDLDSLC